MNVRTILVTEEDARVLRHLLEVRSNVLSRDQQHLEVLERELERAEVVRPEDIPPDVITMHSHVRVRDLDSGKRTTYTLVLPGEADTIQSKVSILAPIGTALLGYREGDEIEWSMPGGWRRLKVEEVMYQPEAAGREPSLGDTAFRTGTSSVRTGGSRDFVRVAAAIREYQETLSEVA